MNQDMIEHVAARLDTAATRLARQMRHEDRESDLSPSRLGALATIAAKGPISLAALAAAEQVRAPTMSRIVEGLVLDELVTRQHDSIDRRTVRITVTEQGVEALNRGRKGQVAALSARLRMLGDSEKRALLRGVELIERLTRN